MKSPEICIYFFTCISPDYVPHESTKELLKNNHFKNMRDLFLLVCQNTLRLITPLNDAFSSMRKNILTNNMCPIKI